MTARVVAKKLEDRLFRYADGVMTERQWIERYADRLEEARTIVEDFYNRRKFSSLEGRAQDEYMKRLHAKAGKPVYRAHRRGGSSFQEVSKKSFDWAAHTLGLPVTFKERS